MPYNDENEHLGTIVAERDKEWLRETIRLCIARDKSAWEELIALLHPKILSTCRQMRLSSEESLDVFGQVCYILLRNLEALKDPDKIVSWVITVTRREALSHDRRSKLLERVEKEAVEIDPPSPPNTPDKQLDEQRQSEILLNAISRLPRKEAQLVYMLFLSPEEPSYEDISAALDMPVSSIGPTRSRVLRKLLRIMKKLGYKF